MPTVAAGAGQRPARRMPPDRRSAISARRAGLPARPVKTERRAGDEVSERLGRRASGVQGIIGGCLACLVSPEAEVEEKEMRKFCQRCHETASVYSLGLFLRVVFDVCVISLTRFVENTSNIYIFK